MVVFGALAAAPTEHQHNHPHDTGICGAQESHARTELVEMFVQQFSRPRVSKAGAREPEY